jgi:hypothetical protein
MRPGEGEDSDEHVRAMKAVLKTLIKEMDDADGRRMTRTFAESNDEDSEQPIDAANIDPEHTESEDEGGHPGELSAGMVDPAESDNKGRDATEQDEDKELLQDIADEKSKKTKPRW